MAAARWDDPNYTGINGGTYDPSTIKGLILRSQQGDLAARNHLKQAGFYDQYGGDVYNADEVKNGFYDNAINSWATGKGLQQSAASPFQWNQNYASGAAGFDTAWDTAFSGMATLPGAQPTTPTVSSTANTIASGLKPAATPAPGGTVTPPAAQPSMATGQQPQAGNNGVGTVTGTQYSSGAGTGAHYAADGSYILPSGEPLPAAAHSTVEINGQQINIPGYYNPQNDRSIFMNGTTAESAMGRLTRRLKDDAANGQNPADPNVIYREMARIRDEAGANGAATGFVHLDRFVRGANGETGFQNAAGVPNAAAGQTAATPVVTPTQQTPAELAAAQAAVAQGKAAEAASAAGAQGQTTGTTAATTTQKDPITGKDVTVQTGTTQGNQTLRNLALGDENAALALVARKLGIDLTRNTLYTKSIYDALKPAVEQRLQLNGLLDGNATDTREASLNDLASTFGNGGGGFSALNQQADQYLADPRLKGVLNNLGDQQAINTYQTLLSQKVAGRNDITNAAYLNHFNQAFGPYGEFAQYSLDNVGNPNAMRPADYIMQSKWADLLNGY